MQKLEKLYLEASALAPAERADFLAKVCGPDESLRREVESLLVYEDAADSFMDVSAFQMEMKSLAEGWEEISAALTGRSIGRYQVQERVGAGGMGVVYHALDTHLGRPVALKVLLPSLTADPERRSRFAREANAASGLNHPNIVTIFDIDRIDGIDFIAMEYVEGRTLRDLIAGGRMTLPDSLELALQIVHALVAAHSNAIVHRDIKPANIMVSRTPDGQTQVKVLDFGLAKLLESGNIEGTEDTLKGAILGTAAYMSPEQAEGKPVDARSDIFSLGSVVYEMLSGRRAFQGDTNLAIISAVLRDEPEPLAGIPSSVQRIVSRCLQKDPAFRIQSAIDLKMALEACLPFSASSRRPVKTIAVLPFANLSGDKDNDYFSDGLTEEIISALTGLPGIRVTARSSAFALRGKGLDARTIGAKLNVEHILEGSVRSSGNRVRITAQVVNVADGYQLWSERYDRQKRDVLEIQDEISRAILDTLRVRLANDMSLVRRHTDNLEAYSLYLRGRHYQEKHTPEGYSKARECFEQAIALDPKYSLAHIGLAEFYWQNAFYGFHYPREALVNAKGAASRALEIDELLPEALALLGTILAMADCDWKAAGFAFHRALQLDPNSPYVLFRYANYYLWPQGRAGEATALLERALSLDPLWVLAHWVLAYYLYGRRQHEDAINHLLTVIEMEPTFYLAYCVLGLAYVQIGMHNEAVRALERACGLCPGSPFTLGTLAYGLGKAGRNLEAKDVLERLIETERHSYVPAKSIMFAYAGLNDLRCVLDFLEKSLNDRDPMTIMNLLQEPMLDPIRSNSRYPALLRKVNLQP